MFRFSQLCFLSCVGTAAICFQGSIGVGCARFWFAGPFLTLLELGDSRRVIAFVQQR